MGLWEIEAGREDFLERSSRLSCVGGEEFMHMGTDGLRGDCLAMG